LLPKVKVEFRHLFSLQKRFSLRSYHNINANIVVFCWLTWFTVDFQIDWYKEKIYNATDLSCLFSYFLKLYFDFFISINIIKSFLLPKVKVEFRHLFSLQKRFSLCSYHNINANIVVFCWLTWFTVE
jgi:hypothetical protein